MPALNSEQSMFGDHDGDVAISPLMVCVATNGVGATNDALLMRTEIRPWATLSVTMCLW
jgi:hypothetical protein